MIYSIIPIIHARIFRFIRAQILSVGGSAESVSIRSVYSPIRLSVCLYWRTKQLKAPERIIMQIDMRETYGKL
jgi:hypothetical protein